MGKIIAAYGGGFKPPTKGHLEVVKKALNDNPEIDEFIIYVGGKERDGIGQTESILIWDIFKKYLPMKVKIEPSKLPIGDIIRLGKNNPEDKIYFVIGGREGRQDDVDDINNRTKNIEASYPNMEVKVQMTPDEGMSGTNARKAAKISSDKLSSFLPDELSDKEKEEVFNIIRPAVSEQLLNENATYSNKINLIQYLAELTQHMLDKGMNIEPLPNLEFIDGDNNNASNFLGKTAYYDPNTQTIVLYTEGRHPKDIARSYAHEMVHHTQFLEDRLGNITTTNTTEDDKLNQIESEAYLKGNMTFRNWTDSLNEKKKIKDPFGLNAYAIELAKGLEEAILNEGKYDSLVTKLAGYTLNAWKGDFNDKQNKGYFEIEIGPGREFDYPHLKFDYTATALFADNFLSQGTAYPRMKMPKINVKYYLDSDELPRMWEQISMDLRNTIRHEIEHLMQSGPNVKKGKEMEDDSRKRQELKTGKKPWWKIWRKTLGTPDYYKLEKEVDANLQGLYLKAKKSRKPLKQIIDNYVKYTLNLPIEDQEEIKRIWAERAPKLNIPLEEGDTYEKMAAKGKKAGKLKQGTVRKRLNIPKDKKIPLSKINKELSRLKKMDKDKDKKGVQLGDKNQKYYKALQLSKTLKTTTNVNEDDPKKGKGKKPKGSSRRLYTDEDPKDTVRVKFSTRQDIIDTLNKKSFKAKSHARQSQVINLIHQRVRAAYNRAKDPKVRKRLKTALDYAEKRKEASKAKTQRLKKQKNENVAINHDGKAAPFGSGYKKLNEQQTYKIFSDMDGVITDFNGRFSKYSDGIPPSEYEKKFGKEKFWELADGGGVAFWVGMPWMSDGKQYWDYIKKYDVELLSSPSRSNTSRLGKRLWVRNNLPGIKLTLAQAAKKQNYAAPNHILIDDRESNIEQWKSQGGIGILHTSAADTINQLKQLGL
jgi:hypothetical protein